MRFLIILAVGFWLLCFLIIWGMTGRFGEDIQADTAAILATVITIAYGLGANLLINKVDLDRKRNGRKVPGFSREEIDEMFLVDRRKSRFNKPSDE